MKAFTPVEKCVRKSAKASCSAHAARKHIFLTGFTLIEVIVALGIFFILASTAFVVMEAGTSSWFAGDIETGLRREIIKAIIPMERELKLTRASQTNLASGAASNSITFSIPQDNDADGTILDAQANIEWSSDADAVAPWTITYSLNGNNEIIRTTSTGGVSVLARNIISLQFTRPISPVNILQVDISAQRQNRKGRVFNDVGQLIVKMRN
jgi:type II secretory pathway component PulJ